VTHDINSKAYLPSNRRYMHAAVTSPGEANRHVGGGASLARAGGGAHTERVNKRSLAEQMIGTGSRPC
jgi:hypothetical protein